MGKDIGPTLCVLIDSQFKPTLAWLDISKKFVSSNFSPRSAVGSDTHKDHPELLKNHIGCVLIILHMTILFWFGWVEVGIWVENQWRCEK